MADNDIRYIPPVPHVDPEPARPVSDSNSAYRASDASMRYSSPDSTGRYDALNVDPSDRFDTLSPDSTGRFQPLDPSSTGRFQPLDPSATGRFSVQGTPEASLYDAVDTSVPSHYGSGDTYRTPYVRRQRPRRTQEAINDLEIDESYAQSFTHDSNVTVKGRNPLSGSVYSRSRANMPQLQRDLHYGQYLSIPKGRRQIFQSRDRTAAIRTRAITSLIIVILIIIAVIAWMLIIDSVK